MRWQFHSLHIDAKGGSTYAALHQVAEVQFDQIYGRDDIVIVKEGIFTSCHFRANISCFWQVDPGNKVPAKAFGVFGFAGADELFGIRFVLRRLIDDQKREMRIREGEYVVDCIKQDFSALAGGYDIRPKWILRHRIFALEQLAGD